MAISGMKNGEKKNRISSVFWAFIILNLRACYLYLSIGRPNKWPNIFIL